MASANDTCFGCKKTFQPGEMRISAFRSLQDMSAAWFHSACVPVNKVRETDKDDLPCAGCGLPFKEGEMWTRLISGTDESFTDYHPHCVPKVESPRPAASSSPDEDGISRLLRLGGDLLEAKIADTKRLTESEDTRQQLLETALPILAEAVSKWMAGQPTPAARANDALVLQYMDEFFAFASADDINSIRAGLAGKALQAWDALLGAAALRYGAVPGPEVETTAEENEDQKAEKPS